MPSAFLLINCKLGSDKEVIDRLKEIPVAIPLVPAAGLFLREEEHAQVMIKLLKEAVRRHGIRVRILTSKDTQEQIEKLIAREESRRRERARQRSIRNRTRKIPNSFTTTTTFTN